MYRNILKIIYFVTILKLSNVYGGTCNGCAELDELLFDKILSKFSTVLVKFDIAYPYGEQHEKYSKFAVETISQNVDFLVAVVGIKDYGQKENSKLAERFRVGAKYPVIKLFRNGNTNEWIDYPKGKLKLNSMLLSSNHISFVVSDLNITVKNLRQFVRRHSNVKIILNGCLQQFDDVASSFMNVALRSSLQSKEVKPLLSEADEQMLKLDNEEVLNQF